MVVLQVPAGIFHGLLVESLGQKSERLDLSRYSANARPDNGQRLADTFALDTVELESRSGDGRFRAPREMAIAHQMLPDGLDAPLPFEPLGTPVGGNMLEKQQAPAR